MNTIDNTMPFQEGTRGGWIPQPEPYKVFLVDDSEDYLELFRVYSKKKNFDVCAVESGQEAIAILAEQQFDCIILDFMLPDLCGADIFQMIQTDERLSWNRETPVVVVSAVSIPAHKLKELYLAGIHLFLPKSFGLRELTVVIENICFAARSRRDHSHTRSFAHVAPDDYKPDEVKNEERRFIDQNLSNVLRFRRRWRENPLI